MEAAGKEKKDQLEESLTQEMSDTRVINMDDLHDFNEEKDRTGIVYLSRIPPMMGPQEVRNYLSPFGEITRLYLTPQEKELKGGKKRGLFIDGWVEFRNKKYAKNAALALNGTTVGGKRTSKYYGELWTLKYLSKLKWSHLTEQIEYERATRQQKLQTEISQAKREASFYLKQVEKAETAGKIEARRAAKREALASGGAVPAPDAVLEKLPVDQDAAMENIRKRFRQRKPILPPKSK